MDKFGGKEFFLWAKMVF